VSQWWTGLTDLASMTSATMYVVVFVLVFVESGLLIGFFLPGDSVLFAAGLLSAEPGSGVSLPVMAGGVAVAAVAGDAVGYWSGRRFGRPWLLRRAGRAAKHVTTAERFYDRWGSPAVVAARFIPWVRTFTPIVAGVARMPYPRFLAANAVGALVWGSGLVLLGWVAHANPAVKWVAYAVAGTAILLSLLMPLVTWRRGTSSGNRNRARRAPESIPTAAETDHRS
jgi:membrane-associated protein